MHLLVAATRGLFNCARVMLVGRPCSLPQDMFVVILSCLHMTVGTKERVHRRVPFLRCEHSISVSARHFLVVLHIETRVTRFRWRSVCVCLAKSEVDSKGVHHVGGSGWKRVSAIMDSGSAECVAPETITRNIPLMETEA